MKIAFASSEIVPFAKTGGLADVAGALPKELLKLGNEVKVFMPKYYEVNEYEYGHEYDYLVGEVKVSTGGYSHSVHVFYGKLPNSEVDIYFIHYPVFFHRNKIYTEDWDEDERFILFSKAVLHVMQKLGWAPDLIHVNDWQTALIPVFLKELYNWDTLFRNTKTVLTIHNIGYQGRFSLDSYKKAELPAELYENFGPLSHEGDSNFLKAGILYSDVINTVSDTYAKELLTPEYGSGMDGYLWLRHTNFFGIVNGVDYTVWDPETDKYIPHHYSIKDMSGKLKNKQFLLDKLNMPFDSERPLIGIVSRLVSQKGFDIITEVLYDLLGLDAQFIILGSGQDEYENIFQEAANNFPDKIGVYFGYNEELAHQIEAGADIFLMPSHYEPCGLNQIYSLKYGTVPVVRKTGGLADTVQDWNEYNHYGQDIGNGFSFYEYSGKALLDSVKRAINDFHNKPVWRKIQANGMEKDYSWKHSAEEYVKLYNRLF
ncbi:MAG: glycogen synthase GlgA [Melioribacteraceae bacterium]|nr:glycogen synthase GlgA [Melioribacteraceae bacterium]